MAAALGLEAVAPAVLTPRLVAPSAVALAITPATPAVATPRVVAPSAAGLSLVAATPTVTATSPAAVVTGGIAWNRIAPPPPPSLAPSPVDAQPAPARFLLKTSQPVVLVNDDDLALALAA